MNDTQVKSVHTPRPSMSTSARIISRLAMIAGIASSLPAWAQPAGFDATTGTRGAVYPPHRLVDFTHMKLAITIADMNTPKATAQQTLSFAPIGGPVSTITLDAKGLSIDSVECRILAQQDSQAAKPAATTFKHNGRTLTINFDPPLPKGQSTDLVISYRIEDPKLGLVWTPESPAWPGRAAQLHTQGQPQTNSYWFPCHDFPNERLSTELLVTAPAGYEVSSNGRLVGRTRKILTSDDATGRRDLLAHEEWHFLQEQPHVNYLVSLVVGKFDVVDVAPKGPVPMPVYVPPGRGKDVKGTYGRTPEMVAHFGTILDEPYPWAKYAQLVVWNFGAGGMENTSATTMYDTAIFAAADQEDHDLDGLISHELGHQWFGDLITCNSWEHIWLNEGFATYMTCLWMERRDGFAAYQQTVKGSMDGTAGADKPDAPNQVGMVSKIYTHPWETFRRPANPYGKGCSILHMLRMKLGDAVFFKGIQTYVDRHKFQTVETADLRRTLEQVSGESLEQFFTQWCYRPGVPSLVVTPAFDAASSTLTITVEQTQKIDGDNPAFEFELPVLVRGGATAPEHRIRVTGRSTTVTIPCEQAPSCIIVDPMMTVLASMEVKQDEAAFLAQLEHGPTPASRITALKGLRGDVRSSKALESMRQLVLDSTQPAWLRSEAVRTLGACKSAGDLRALATTHIDAWEVREALTSELPGLARGDDGDSAAGADHIARLLIDRAAKDSSLRVRCAALRGIGTLKSKAGLPLVLEALTQDSQSDGLRQAALEALASFDDAAYLPRVLACTQPGFDSRTRPHAVGIAVRLAHHNPDAVFEVLSKLLTDRELRTARAAGEGLVQMKHPKAAEAITAALETQEAEEIAWQAGQWLKALRTK
jgi:aminopeptidase N